MVWRNFGLRAYRFSPLVKEDIKPPAVARIQAERAASRIPARNEENIMPPAKKAVPAVKKAAAPPKKAAPLKATVAPKKAAPAKAAPQATITLKQIAAELAEGH